MSKLLEALDRFDALFRRAATCDLNEPSAVTVATVDARGRPSARVVLVKGYDASGFVFYTNAFSRKGRELAANPRVAMCLFWDPLMEQVRVEGRVAPVSGRAGRRVLGRPPSGKPARRLGVGPVRAASEGREVLEARVASFAGRFGDGPIPRPAHWSGYRVVPDRIEFWRSLPEPPPRAHLLRARRRRVARVAAPSMNGPPRAVLIAALLQRHRAGRSRHRGAGGATGALRHRAAARATSN